MNHPSRGFEPDDEGSEDGVGGPPLAKPDELLALHGVTDELFLILQGWFDVPTSVSLDLRSIDSAVRELGDPQMVAALAMRKLQALHLLATPGVRTATDVVVAIVNDLERAMVQAPNMWLKRRAASTDWDQALAELSDGLTTGLEEAPVDAEELDPEVVRFRILHNALHEAMFAVVEASDGEIRELE